MNVDKLFGKMFYEKISFTDAACYSRKMERNGMEIGKKLTIFFNPIILNCTQNVYNWALINLF